MLFYVCQRSDNHEHWDEAMPTRAQNTSVEHAFNTLKSEIEPDRLYEIARQLASEFSDAEDLRSDTGTRRSEAVIQWTALVEETAGTLGDAGHHKELLDRILSECRPRN